jgi:hypothetical protein
MPALGDRFDDFMVRSDPRITQDRIQVGLFGRSEEVAEVAVTLACSGYFTGRSINPTRVGPGWGKLPRLVILLASAETPFAVVAERRRPRASLILEHAY